jgi:hypothetical protein
MYKSIRDSLTTTVIAMTPLLLAACGDDGSNNKGPNTSLFLAALAICSVSLVRNVLRERAARNIG